jgi:cell division septation protein DedD
MAPSYYVIELTARWLTILLVALALVMVLAFAFGYGAAWSVLASREPGPRKDTVVAAMATPTPTPVEVVIESPAEDPTPRAVPTRKPSATAVPPPATPKPKPTQPPKEELEGYWVQVLASGNQTSVEKMRAKLAESGFTRDRQQVVTTAGSGGIELFKLRVGPFPDRSSAERVAERMKSSEFPDAWVVAP